MKTAVVLAGGGSKGAYEIGFYQAFEELKLSVDIVTGTSIGSLIGCLMVQDDFKVAYDLWDNMDISQVMNNGISINGNIDTLVSQTNRFIPFFKGYITHKGADITPFKDMIARLCDEEKARKSPIDFGLVTVEYPSLQPVQITKSEMEEGMMKDYLLASASCFPAFPVHEFNEKGYIDGGYYDNLPLRLAKKMGADRFILVDLNYKNPIHMEYMNRPNITYIIPSFDIGSFLDFDKKDIDHRIRLGYLDTMRAFQKYHGFRYTFSGGKRKSSTSRTFYNMILYLEAEINAGSIRKKIKAFNPQPLSENLRDFARKPYLEIEDYENAALEICAQILEIDYLEIYSYSELRKLVLHEFTTYGEDSEEVLSTLTPANVLKIFSVMNSKQVMKILYYHLIKSNFVLEPITIYTMLGNELIAALYLYIQLNKKHLTAF